MGTTAASTATTSLDTLTLAYEFTLAFRDQLNAVLAELDLNESLAGVLWALEPTTPAVPLRELARRLHCDPSNVTLMSNKLVKAGLVERRPHPTDGRSRVLALTERGLDLWDRLFARVEQTSLIFNLDANEREAFVALLAKLLPAA